MVCHNCGNPACAWCMECHRSVCKICFNELREVCVACVSRETSAFEKEQKRRTQEREQKKCYCGRKASNYEQPYPCCAKCGRYFCPTHGRVNEIMELGGGRYGDGREHIWCRCVDHPRRSRGFFKWFAPNQYVAESISDYETADHFIDIQN